MYNEYEFKVGQDVKVCNHHGKVCYVDTVTNVWKNGVAVISKGRKYNPDGLERCGNSLWYRDRIKPLQKGETKETVEKQIVSERKKKEKQNENKERELKKAIEDNWKKNSSVWTDAQTVVLNGVEFRIIETKTSYGDPQVMLVSTRIEKDTFSDRETMVAEIGGFKFNGQNIPNSFSSSSIRGNNEREILYYLMR